MHVIQYFRMASARKGHKSFKPLLVVASITFPILIIFYVTHQNSIFDIFQDVNLMIEGFHNTTTNISESVVSK